MHIKDEADKVKKIKENNKALRIFYILMHKIDLHYYHYREKRY